MPTLQPVRKITPSAAMRFTRRRTTSFCSFILGMPYISRPPIRSARSNTVTVWPRRLSWSAAANPAGPEPTTATCFPVRTLGTCGTMSPRAYPSSTMANSFSFTVTGSPFRPQVQAASHRAGHTRPVNSGKLLVFRSRFRAWSRLPWYTRSFHSGTRLCSGQPVYIPASCTPDWQKGTPHSMHRAPCRCLSSSGCMGWNSFQCRMRSRGACAGLLRRG